MRGALGERERERESRHVAKGGSEGADEPPFFSDQKKSRWCPCLAAACFVCDRACMHRRVGLRIRGPEPNLESVAV